MPRSNLRKEKKKPNAAQESYAAIGRIFQSSMKKVCSIQPIPSKHVGTIQWMIWGGVVIRIV